MSQPLFRENAKKFYQNAYKVQRSKSSNEDKQSNEVALPASPTLKIAESGPAKIGPNMTLSQIQRHQQGDHTFRNVILFLLIVGVGLFVYDLVKEIQQQKIELQIKRKKCYDQYVSNQCENAFDAIKAKCHQLQVCFKQEADMTLRASHSAAKLLGRLVSAFLKETGWLGAALVVAILIITFTFIYKASRSALTHQMTYKRQ